MRKNSMTMTEISKMSITDRLQIMEDIWDSLTHEADNLESPEWHGDLLAQRRKKIEEGKAQFISLEDLKAKHAK